MGSRMTEEDGRDNAGCRGVAVGAAVSSFRGVGNRQVVLMGAAGGGGIPFLLNRLSIN